MIIKQEIMDFSREFSLSPNTIEKDYVLGWLLAGIANSELMNTWIFKGGTCLKKCYFETYRFSEDLDYTLIDEKHLDEKFLVENFKQVAIWIYEAVGIEIPEKNIRFDIYQNSSGKISGEGSIYYVGPLQRRGSLARIKIDLTADEILVLPKVLREVHHPYSDKPENGIPANCYSFSEIFAEKIRALGERARPRDLYDVIHLYRHANPGKSTSIFDVLKKKCEYKGIAIPTMKHLRQHPKLHELEAEWNNMLAHQLPMLPSREQFWQELPSLFEWLHNDNNRTVLASAPLPVERINNSWKPPSMIQAWHAQAPLELVRYAAANHLCIELFYSGSKRLIEPYDLKKTQDGNLIIIAIKHATGEPRSYRVDRIQGVEVTNVPFIPKYNISMTPFSEPLSTLKLLKK